MSWGDHHADYQFMDVAMSLMQERNKIERAKLAEMRAARLVLPCVHGVQVSQSSIDTLNDAQADADKLTAEVLGDDEN